MCSGCSLSSVTANDEEPIRLRSRVQTIPPSRAAELVEANTTKRPVPRSVVRSFAEAMKRGEWIVTHQGIAFEVNGVLIVGEHRTPRGWSATMSHDEVPIL